MKKLVGFDKSVIIFYNTIIATRFENIIIKFRLSYTQGLLF